MPRKLTFAVDIDGTLDQDPKAFQELIYILEEQNGHRVLIVTGASSVDVEKRKRLLIAGRSVMCTAGKPKKAFLDYFGVHIDIWIDNDPASITSLFIKPNIDDEL